MDYTYLDYFNYYLKEYLNELINAFPETQEPLLANYRPLLENRDDKNDIYAKCFYTKINNFLGPIARKEETLFETPGKIFIEGVDLHFIWNNTNANEQNRLANWKYLQILMILGRKIIPNHKEIVEILNKISNGEINVPAKVEKTLASDEKDDIDSTPSIFGLGDIASSLGSLGSLGSLLGGSEGLGKIGEMIGGSGGLGGLMSNFTDMLNNPEFTNAMSQLSQSFVHSESSADENGECAGTDCPPMDDKGVAGESGKGQASSEFTNASGASTSGSAAAPPPLFNNPLFGELAEELTKTFNFEEMEKDGKPKNIGEALGRFMSGNNPAKLMGLVGKFGNKLQEEVKKGSINPADLLSQTMAAAGGAGGLPQNIQNMMNNPQVRQQMNRAAQQNTTRDRLRAKLEKKNSEKGE
jgi:hypothetical protein